MKSINDFTSSLAKTLVEAEGMPSKESTERLVVMCFALHLGVSMGIPIAGWVYMGKSHLEMDDD